MRKLGGTWNLSAPPQTVMLSEMGAPEQLRAECLRLVREQCGELVEGGVPALVVPVTRLDREELLVEEAELGTSFDVAEAEGDEGVLVLAPVGGPGELQQSVGRNLGVGAANGGGVGRRVAGARPLAFVWFSARHVDGVGAALDGVGFG